MSHMLVGVCFFSGKKFSCIHKQLPWNVYLKDKERSPVPLTPGSLSKMDTVNEVCLLQNKLPDTDRDPFNGKQICLASPGYLAINNSPEVPVRRSPALLASKAKRAGAPQIPCTTANGLFSDSFFHINKQFSREGWQNEGHATPSNSFILQFNLMLKKIALLQECSLVIFKRQGVS